jgi:type II secretory pathway component PulF
VPKFSYTAKSVNNGPSQGTIEADTKAIAVQKLQTMGYFPLSLEIEGEMVSSPWEIPISTRVPLSELGLTYRQLSDLTQAGFSMATALKMTGEQTSHPKLKSMLTTAANEVHAGKGLSNALEVYPDCFKPLHIQLIAAGEMGGMLAGALERLANMVDKEDETRAQIKAALAYPIFICIVGAITVTFLLGVIVPKLSVMFADFQESLPLPTKLLLAVSGVIRRYGLILLTLAVMGGFSIRKTQILNRVRLWIDKVSLHIPLLKGWVLKYEIAQYTRTLGLLLGQGVPLLKALETSSGTVSNKEIKSILQKIPDQVSHGASLSGCLKEIKLFPPYVCNLTAIAEEGGILEQSLMKIADSYDRQAQRDLKMVVSLLEPMMILIIGAILGVIVISIMLPIFEINQLMH